ncbi:MAG: DNA N-6-adenine-methyltransferase [Verrucomicrobiota bacterium]
MHSESWQRLARNFVEEATVPPWLFDALNRQFHFTLDPCSTHANAVCAHHFTKTEDGLTQDWGQLVVFMNPPGGDAISAWMRKAVASAAAGATVVCFVPNDPHSDWWIKYVPGGEVRSLCCSLEPNGFKFGDSRALVIFRPNPETNRTPQIRPMLSARL